MKTTVMLFRTEEGAWKITSYKGEIVPSSEFKTAASAKAYAKSRNWNVRRATNCYA